MARFAYFALSILLSLAMSVPSSAGESAETLARYQEALDLSHANRIPEAMAFTYQLLQDAPDFVEAHRLYIDLLAAQGRAEDAIHFYALALSAAPKSPAAHYLYGRATNDPAIAEQEFRTAIQLDSNFAWAHHGLGAALALKGDTDAAIGEFEKAIEIRPDLSDAHSHLANLYLSQERDDDAIAAYRRAIEQAPANADAYFYLGTYFAHRDRYEEALDLLEDAASLDVHNPMIYMELGTVYVYLNQETDALSAFDEGLKRDSRDEYLRDLRAATDAIIAGTAPHDLFRPFRTGLEALSFSPDAAIAAFDEALVLAPDFYLAHLNRGIALAGLGRNDEAETAIMQAIELNPRYPEGHASLAVVMLAEERAEEAEACLQQALALDPAHVEALRGMGMVYMVQERAELAASYLLRASNIDSANLTLKVELVSAYVQSGDIVRAEETLRSILKADPSFNFARYQLAALLNEQQRFDEAIAELEELKKHVSTSVEIDALIAQVRGARYGIDRENAPRMRLSQIVVKDRALANDIASRLAAGEEFSNLARAHSIGPTAAQGGDIGTVSTADIQPLIAGALEGLAVGGHSGVVEAPGGFLILKRTE